MSIRQLFGRRRQEEMKDPPAEHVTAYSNRNWGALATAAEQLDLGRGAVVEASRRVVWALEKQERSSGELGNQIRALNVWLLIFTIVICLLTAVQVWALLKGGR